jgi:hypothetical protein
MSKLIEGNEHYGIYINTKSKGRVECNHNDLMSIIEFDRRTFNIEWSKRNANSVYIYRDAFNIDSVALADGIENIHQIENATFYDRSKRTVTVEVGQVALVQNIYGVWAAIKLITVENKDFDTGSRPPRPKNPKPWDVSHVSGPKEKKNLSNSLLGKGERLVFDYEISESYNFLK